MSITKKVAAIAIAGVGVEAVGVLMLAIIPWPWFQAWGIYIPMFFMFFMFLRPLARRVWRAK